MAPITFLRREKHSAGKRKAADDQQREEKDGERKTPVIQNSGSSHEKISFRLEMGNKYADEIRVISQRGEK